MPNPTIVVASLSDDKLKESIETMVKNLNDGLNRMKNSTDQAVDYIQKSLKKIGDTKIDTGGSADGGASRRTKAQKEQTAAVKETTTAYDNMAAAMQKAAGGSKNIDVTQTMKIQLDLMIERLREARNQYSSFVALAAHATTTGDEGLFKFATDGVHRYKQEVESLIHQIRNTREAISQMGEVLAPQGHAFENYVKSLMQANPELALMNKLFKTGNWAWSERNTALKQVSATTQKTIADSKDEAEAAEKAAQAEKKWADNVRDRGRAAQETTQKMIRMLHEESQSGGTGLMGFYKIDGKEINAVRELDNALKEMKAAYNLMSDAEKASPLGEALKRDIIAAQEASRAISAYNALSLGIIRGDKSLRGRDLLHQEAASINSLKNTLKALTDQYNTLTAAQIKAGQADGLIQKIQTLTRESQKLQNQLNRPVSFDAAMKLSTKTLDDMAYKLRQLQAYKQGIDLTKPNAAQEINKVDAAIVQLKKDMDKYMSSTKVAEQTTNALTRSINYMKNRLAFYFTVGASTQFVKNLIDIRAQYEMNERALGILINSAERGSQIFKELSDMALVSPYTLIELSTAAKQLTAYDIAAKDVVDTTRRLADMTAAVGIPIERLTYAIGQVKAYGYLNARDARMFSNAGIPLVKELADYYTKLEGRIVSVADVYDKIKKKAIGYNDVMSVVTKMTDEGGKFFDFQAKMAGTLKVQLANLTLAWNNMLNEIGSSKQGAISSVIVGLKELFLQWKNINKVIWSVIYAFGLWKTAQLTALAATGNLTAAMAGQIVMGTKLQAKMASMAAGFKSASMGISAAGMAFWLVLGDAIMTYRRNAEEIEQLNKSIADGAKESAESLSKFLEGTEIYQNRLNAATGKLPKAEAEKTWEAMREQIELTADSSDEIIAKLLDPKKYDNINDRLTAGFEVLDSIREVTSKIGDAFENLEVSQDSILFGAFGEGLAEDIDDYNERLKYTTEVAEWAAKKNKGFWDNAVMGLKSLFSSVKEDLGSSEGEAQEEIRNFALHAAETIKDELGEEGLKDKVQINEAIARVIQGMEKQFPQIRGKGKALFESIFYDVMSNEFEGAVDKQTYYYNQFLNRLKKDHASAFQDVTDGILSDTHTWSSAQLDAINKTADRVKDDLPAASQDAINQILQQLNSTEFKLKIVAEFATTTQDEVNKQFRKQFIEAPAQLNKDAKEQFETEQLQKFGTLMKKSEESNLEYEDRIRKKREENLKISKDNAKIIEANKNKTDDASKAIVANAKEEKKAADDFLESSKKVEDWGGYDFSTKKENRDAAKAQKTAEQEVTEAIKNELSVIRDMQSNYEKMRKAGVDNTTAVDLAARGYEDTLVRVNATLSKYGISKFNAKDFLGKDVNSVLRTLEKQRDDALASGKLKTSALKELDVEISKLNVEAKTYNMEMITKGLNNELGKLKDEYELAVSLDADPELGGAFADLMGVNIETLPRTVQEYADRYTELMNRYLSDKNVGITLPHLDLTRDDLNAFSEMVKENKLNEEVYNHILKAVKEVREERRKDIEEHIKSWNRLLEKYSEYETKIRNIEKVAAGERKGLITKFGTEDEKRTAIMLETKIAAEEDPEKRQQLVNDLGQLADDVSSRNDKAARINVAIGNKESQDKAKTSFEEFQKSPEWILATGDLANLSKAAIGGLISELEKYKKSAKNLDPKQIKQLNSALSKLYKEQRKNNPFRAIGNMLQQAKENAAAYNEEIEDIQKQMEDLGRKSVGGLTDDEEKKLESLTKKWEELKQKQEDAGKVDATQWVSAINETVSAVGAAVGVFDDLAKAIGGVNTSDVDKMFSILEKGGQGAAAGAQIGGGYGAIIGAVAGLATGIIATYADQLSGNAALSRGIRQSEIAVKRLENAYLKLQDAIENAYGTAAIFAKKVAITNKELQLAELQRQLQLEQARKSKNKDEAKIEEIRGQITSLEIEIKNAVNDITNDFLGISSIGDAMNSMMDGFIDALRNGEDAMAVFNNSVDDMIVNMIKQMFTAKILAPMIEKIWNQINDDIQKRGSMYIDSYTQWMQNIADAEAGRHYTKYLVPIMNDDGTASDWRETSFEEWKAWALSVAEKNREKAEQATTPTTEDIRKYAELLRGVEPEMEEQLDYLYDILNQFGLINSTSDKQLSALQQGIQGITEDTAGALEAYMNGVSQQVYLHSEILTQIRDAVAGLNSDVMVGSISQILLQLRSSYEIQQAIHSMLSGWSNSSGQAVRVEMI